MLTNDKAVIRSAFHSARHAPHYIDVVRVLRIPAAHWLCGVALRDSSILVDYAGMMVPKSKARTVSVSVEEERNGDVIVYIRKRSYVSQVAAENWLIKRCNMIAESTYDSWCGWLRGKVALDAVRVPGHLIKILLERIDHLEVRLEYSKNRRK